MYTFSHSFTLRYTAPLLEGGKAETPVAFVNHAAPITSVGSSYQSLHGKWSSDMGHHVVSGDQEGLVRGIMLCRVTSREAYPHFPGPSPLPHPVTHLSPRILQITVWEASSSKRLSVVGAVSSSSVPVASVTVRQGSIIAARLDGTICIYDLVGGEECGGRNDRMMCINKHMCVVKV